MHLLLDIKRWRVDNEIAPVLRILATPDQLRIQILVPSLICHPDRILRFLGHNRLILGCRDVLPPCFLVRQRLHRFRAVSAPFRLTSHGQYCPSLTLRRPLQRSCDQPRPRSWPQSRFPFRIGPSSPQTPNDRRFSGDSPPESSSYPSWFS